MAGLANIPDLQKQLDNSMAQSDSYKAQLEAAQKSASGANAYKPSYADTVSAPVSYVPVQANPGITALWNPSSVQTRLNAVQNNIPVFSPETSPWYRQSVPTPFASAFQPSMPTYARNNATVQSAPVQQTPVQQTPVQQTPSDIFQPTMPTYTRPEPTPIPTPTPTPTPTPEPTPVSPYPDWMTPDNGWYPDDSGTYYNYGNGTAYNPDVGYYGLSDYGYSEPAMP